MTKWTPYSEGQTARLEFQFAGAVAVNDRVQVFDHVFQHGALLGIAAEGLAGIRGAGAIGIRRKGPPAGIQIRVADFAADAAAAHGDADLERGAKTRSR